MKQRSGSNGLRKAVQAASDDGLDLSPDGPDKRSNASHTPLRLLRLRVHTAAERPALLRLSLPFGLVAQPVARRLGPPVLELRQEARLGLAAACRWHPGTGQNRGHRRGTRGCEFFAGEGGLGWRASAEDRKAAGECGSAFSLAAALPNMGIEPWRKKDCP